MYKMHPGYVKRSIVSSFATTATFLYLQFGCLTANTEPLLSWGGGGGGGGGGREEPHSPDVNHYVLSIFDPKVTRSLVTRLGS